MIWGRKRGQKRRANEYGRRVMGKVFRQPVTMRAYKYVNELYYIPTCACRCAPFEDLFVDKRRAVACAHAHQHLHELVIIPTNEIIKERLLCASWVVFPCFFGILFALLVHHSFGRLIGISFYHGCPSACNLLYCYFPSEIFLWQILKKLNL